MATAGEVPPPDMTPSIEARVTASG